MVQSISCRFEVQRGVGKEIGSRHAENGMRRACIKPSSFRLVPVDPRRQSDLPPSEQGGEA